jgi:hypothetical protein
MIKLAEYYFTKPTFSSRFFNFTNIDNRVYTMYFVKWTYDQN